MSAEVRSPEIEFRVVDGEEARLLDPAKLDWPLDSKVLFAFENNQVVGRSSLTIMPMIAVVNTSLIEGSWVREDKRGTSLAFRLIKKVEDLFRENNKTHALAFAYDAQPEIADYLTRVGFEKLPLTIYMKQLVETEGVQPFQ